MPHGRARGRLASYKDHNDTQNCILAEYCMQRYEEEWKAWIGEARALGGHYPLGTDHHNRAKFFARFALDYEAVLPDFCPAF